MRLTAEPAHEKEGIMIGLQCPKCLRNVYANDYATARLLRFEHMYGTSDQKACLKDKD